MFNWLRKERSISDVVFETKKIVVWGVPFTIRRMSAMNHLDGSKVMTKSYDVYKSSDVVTGGQTPANTQMSKIKDHFIDVIMAGVVSPKLSRKKGVEGEFYVDDLFENDQFAGDLYVKIMEFTYGKKKMKLFHSLGKGLLTSMSSPKGTA